MNEPPTDNPRWHRGRTMGQWRLPAPRKWLLDREGVHAGLGLIVGSVFLAGGWLLG